jgi:hypothetical protein
MMERCAICGRPAHRLEACGCSLPDDRGPSIVSVERATYWVLRCVHGNPCVWTPTLLQVPR